MPVRQFNFPKNVELPEGLSREAFHDLVLGKGGTYSLSRDVLPHQLWDTRFFESASANNFVYFTQPQGSQWRNNSTKTLNETNMSSTGQLPTGQTFLVKRIGIALIAPLAYDFEGGADIVQAFTNLIQSSVFEIHIAGREFDFQVHGRQFLPSIAVTTDTSDANNNLAVQRSGDMIASGWVSLRDIPIFINNQVNFTVRQYLGNPDANVVTILEANATWLYTYYCTLQVTLEGTFTRAK